jgi:hypothetical protein
MITLLAFPALTPIPIITTGREFPDPPGLAQKLKLNSTRVRDSYSTKLNNAIKGNDVANYNFPTSNTKHDHAIGGWPCYLQYRMCRKGKRK